MKDLKNKVEALLFSSGRRMHIDEISKLCRKKPEEVKPILEELKTDFNELNRSLMIVEEGDHWKLTSKEDYLPLVRKIVSQTEISKSITETLAVIAFKYPIKQADLIKIRTNKAYDHLKMLEEAGYISRQKHGRSKLIKLTQKFFDYFSLPEEKLRDKFQDFEGIAQAIELKEGEIKRIKEEQKKQAKEARQNQEAASEEVDLVDDKGNKIELEVFHDKLPKEESDKKVVDHKKQSPELEPYTDKLGNLEIVNEDNVEGDEIDSQNLKDSDSVESTKTTNLDEVNESSESQEAKEEAGLKTTAEMEKLVEKRVNEILTPEGESNPVKEDETSESQDELESDSKDKEKNADS